MNTPDCCIIEDTKKGSLTPLYILLLGILFLSIGLTFLFGELSFMSFMMYLMALWFGAFGILKLLDLRGFVCSFRLYDPIAKHFSLYGYLYPFIEIAIGFIYFFDTSMRWITPVNYIAGVLAIIGIYSAYTTLRSGKSILCACMGTFWKLPMTKVTVIENTAMLVMVLYMIVWMGSMNMSMGMGNMTDTNMKNHCQMMPEMQGCEKYNTSHTATTATQSGKTLNEIVLVEDPSVMDAKPTEVINLKDGDTYNITVGKVRKVIGGKTYIMLSYNGSIPGPTFRAPKGATVKFQVRNTVKELATTIHPHGIRLNYIYDGVPKDQGGVQDPIKVGDVYEQIIKFPDTGTFWYHPHTRDDFEQELGEYGTFQIYDPAEKQATDSENVITLDDILIENGAIAPFYTETVNHTLMGRYGNTMFINGDTNFSLSMKQGEVKRLYLVNTANARPFDFAIPGVKMKLIRGDASYYQNETFIDHIIVAPAERYTVDIMPERSGDYPLQSIGGGKIIALGVLKVEPSQKASSYKTSFETLKSHDILGSLASSLKDYEGKTPDKNLKITLKMEGMDSMGDMQGMGGMDHGMMGGMGGMGMEGESPDGIEWEDTMAMMNITSTNKTLKWVIRDEDTKKEGMDISWSFNQGSLIKIHITNDKDAMHTMQHPFHMHGQRFLVLNQNGTLNTNLVWKDTVLIPKDQYADILVDMSNPGTWMAHCHVVEHLLSGMMFHFEVKP